MNPLAIALQGIGFGAVLTSIQGFGNLQIADELSSPLDDDRGTRIQQQNRTLISLLIGFAAQGAFE